jgi:hypothetical protein
MATVANDAPFTISLVGEASLETWAGTFRAKTRLSHRDQLSKDARRRELLGNQPGTSTERALTTAMILAELSVRLTDAPKWWSEKGGGLDLEDDNVIGAVYDKAMTIEKEAADDKKKKAEAAQAEMRAEADKAATEAK